VVVDGREKLSVGSPPFVATAAAPSSPVIPQKSHVGRKLALGCVATVVLLPLIGFTALSQCGNGGSPNLDDTWTWTGGDWHESAAFGAHPGWRTGAVFVYDSDAKHVLMFGGEGPSNACPNETECELNETWTWSGHWSRYDPTNAPPPRTAAAAGYDPARKQVILFGGWSAVGTPSAVANNPIEVLTDTWAWEGTQWTRLVPLHSPPLSGGSASMGWDPATKTLVMIDQASPESGTLAATWSWDGTDWTKHESDAEPPTGIVYSDDIRGTAMVIGHSGQFSWTGAKWVWASPLTDRGDAGVAFDPQYARLMSFGSGGCGGSGGNNAQTWVSTDGGWKAIATANHPNERAGSYLAYDSDIKGSVLFGGYHSWGCGGLF
jgi:hypothetical protein